MMNNILLDIETTGLEYNSDRIIEICCLKIKNRKLTNKIFHVYLNPDKIISNEAYKIHNIRNEFLKKKPRFYDIAYDFLKFIYNSNLIIHNSEFDLNFINYELKLLGLKSIKNFYNKLIDTLQISKSIFPKKKNTLDALSRRFNIECERDFHSAYIDVKILFKIYLNLTSKNLKIKFVKKNKKNKINSKKIKNITLKKRDKFFLKYINKFNNF